MCIYYILCSTAPLHSDDPVLEQCSNKRILNIFRAFRGYGAVWGCVCVVLCRWPAFKAPSHVVTRKSCFHKREIASASVTQEIEKHKDRNFNQTKGEKKTRVFY